MEFFIIRPLLKELNCHLSPPLQCVSSQRSACRLKTACASESQEGCFELGLGNFISAADMAAKAQNTGSSFFLRKLIDTNKLWQKMSSHTSVLVWFWGSELFYGPTWNKSACFVASSYLSSPVYMWYLMVLESSNGERLGGHTNILSSIQIISDIGEFNRWFQTHLAKHRASFLPIKVTSHRYEPRRLSWLVSSVKSHNRASKLAGYSLYASYMYNSNSVKIMLKAKAIKPYLCYPNPTISRPLHNTHIAGSPTT